MKKVLFILLSLLFVLNRPCEATDNSNDELLSFISRTTQTVTQVKVTSLLGAPARIEESRKRVLWYYTKGTNNLVISWNKKSELPEKFSFTSTHAGYRVFDKSLSSKLKSGSTDISQAVKILGTPKVMTIKTSTQVLNYVFGDKMLRLFFRDRKLVDFCLY